MKSSYHYIHILILIFLLQGYEAQSQTFKAQLEAGVNFSQIDGDAEAGFNKVGFNGGLTVAVNSSERWQYSLGIMFAQKGSRSAGQAIEPFKINLNYVDIPLMVSYLDYRSVDDAFYHIKWQAGLVIGQLIKSESDIPGIQSLTEYFNKTDIAYRFGATVFFTKHIGLGLHYQRSFNRLYTSSKSPQIYNNDLQYHLIQTQLIYSL